MASASGSSFILMAFRSQYHTFSENINKRIFHGSGLDFHNLPARRCHDAALGQTRIGCMAMLELDDLSSIGSSCNALFVDFAYSTLDFAINSFADYHVEIPC